MTILFATNKVGFVNSSIKRRKNTDVDYMAWMHCDVMVRGWLTTTMEKNIKNSVKYVRTASEILNNLLEWYRKESAPNAYGLKQILIGTQQEGAYGSIYYKKLRWTYDKMQAVLAIHVVYVMVVHATLEDKW